jgi:hypothetical protein
MLRLLFYALLLVTLCAATTGCVPKNTAPMTMFFGNCIIPLGPDPCDSDMDICRVYEGVVNDEHASAQACLAACTQAFWQLDRQYEIRNCGYMVRGGCDLCEQQCLRLYPEKK